LALILLVFIVLVNLPDYKAHTSEQEFGVIGPAIGSIAITFLISILLYIFWIIRLVHTIIHLKEDKKYKRINQLFLTFSIAPIAIYLIVIASILLTMAFQHYSYIKHSDEFTNIAFPKNYSYLSTLEFSDSQILRFKTSPW
jgi:hypothetical protein